MNSKIIMCKNIHLDREYTNVLNYTESQMLAMCSENIVASADKYSFIRPTSSIMVDFSYKECIQSNYIAFQNPDYSNKWFFAWIDDVIYKGNKNCELTFTIDAWSTWFGKWTAKECFVQREHVNDDTIGANTLPENLDVGDVVEESSTYDSALSDYYYVAMDTSWIIKDDSTGTELSDKDHGTQHAGISVYNKQVFGNKIILFNQEDYISLGLYILRTNLDGHIADINNIFIVPASLVKASNLIQHTAYSVEKTENLKFTFYELKYSFEVGGFDFDVDKLKAFADFQPKNNKCFVYPYNYLFVSNNIGNTNIYKYENFYGSEKATFRIDLAMCIGASGKLTPTNYKKMARNNDESLPLAKFPTCSWSSDAFTNWLTQNAVNEATSLAFGIFGAGSEYSSSVSAVNKNNAKVEETGKGDMMSTTSASVGLATNIAGSVSKQIGNFYAGALMPNIQGGQNTGDVNWASNLNTFIFRQMRVKTENLRIIDEYFTRFGYTVNRLKVPNITGRNIFNYVEIGGTEDIGFGSVPNKFMDTINKACRRGVTIWHNHKNIGNYSLDNKII